MCVRHMRAKDDAFELPVMTDIDGVFRKPGHFLPCLDAWRDDIVAVEATRAGLGQGAEDAVIGAAAAQMTRKRGADFLPRRCRGSPCLPPGIVKCRRLDNKTGRTESALQGVMRHERL